MCIPFIIPTKHLAKVAVIMPIQQQTKSIV